MYGRGMPRPIAEVTSITERRMANYWVAACRDRTTTATHSRSDFNRRRNNYDPIATATSTDEGTTAPHSNSNFNQQKKQLHPITAAIAPAQGAATPPFLPLHSQLPPPPILHEPQNKTRLYLLHLKKNA